MAAAVSNSSPTLTPVRGNGAAAEVGLVEPVLDGVVAVAVIEPVLDGVVAVAVVDPVLDKPSVGRATGGIGVKSDAAATAVAAPAITVASRPATSRIGVSRRNMARATL
jgi:hypothetical protein